jgi:fermentation-respiration switch protein FrsA (DUF1100 family)
MRECLSRTRTFARETLGGMLVNRPTLHQSIAATAALIVLLFCLQPLGAQAIDPERRGELIFEMGGTRAGSESYSITREGSTFVLEGDVKISIPGLALDQKPMVTTDLAFHPIRVTVDALLNGVNKQVRLDFADGIMKTTIVSDGTLEESKVAYNPDCLFLASNVLHHILPFIFAYDMDKAGKQSFCTIPDQPVTVELRDRGVLHMAGGPVSYSYFFCNVANLAGLQIFMSENGNLMKTYLPLQDFAAVDTRYAALADSLEPPREAGQASLPEGILETEIRFRSGDIELAGTVTMPAGAGPYPGAVLISGSGAQNRDEDSPGKGGLKLHIFRRIALTLARKGIASLRYDDRGVGQSGGVFSGATLEDFTDDARAAVYALRHYEHIDPERVSIIGHSEGAIIGPVIAGGDAGISALILMGGPAQSMHEILIHQNRYLAEAAGQSPEDLQEALDDLEILVDFLTSGQAWDPEKVPSRYKDLGASHEWLRQHLLHDPAGAIRAVRCPVLIVQGGKDFQVPPENATMLGEALGDAGNPDVEVRIFDELSHLFAGSEGGGMAEYSDSDIDVDEEFLAYIAEWLRLRSGGVKGVND